MEKKMYESPHMEMVKMEVSDMMACSVNAGGDVNIGYGGEGVFYFLYKGGFY